MKLKIKFANKEVNVKKLAQGAVVLYHPDPESDPEVYHIHKFQNLIDNYVDLIITDDFGKWEKNSADLTWPI